MAGRPVLVVKQQYEARTKFPSKISFNKEQKGCTSEVTSPDPVDNDQLSTILSAISGLNLS
jgi:hypothetical protein